MGLKISGIFAASTIDKSAELLLMEGLDISSLEKGNALANVEHTKANTIDPKGGIAGWAAYVGSIRYVKKIFKAEDCETEDQEKFWKTVEVPMLYGIVELFDDQDHGSAKALAAMIKFYHEKGEPLAVGFSIEGDTLEKTSSGLIKHAIARSVRNHPDAHVMLGLSLKYLAKMRRKLS